MKELSILRLSLVSFSLSHKCKRDRIGVMDGLYCIEASAGIYKYKTWGARLPVIHMAVYDTNIYNYQIYSNTPPQSQREHCKR